MKAFLFALESLAGYALVLIVLTGLFVLLVRGC